MTHPDQLYKPKPGDRPSASQQGHIVDLLKRRHNPQGAGYVDGNGVLQRPRPNARSIAEEEGYGGGGGGAQNFWFSQHYGNLVPSGGPQNMDPQHTSCHDVQGMEFGYGSMVAGTVTQIQAVHLYALTAGAITFKVGKVSGATTTWSAQTCTITFGAGDNSSATVAVTDLTLAANDRLIAATDCNATYAVGGSGAANICGLRVEFVPDAFAGSGGSGTGGGCSDMATVYLSANQTISGSTWTKVNLNTEEHDDDANFAGGTYTCPTDGKYLVIGHMTGTGNAFMSAGIDLNGTIVAQGNLNVGYYSEASKILDCTAADTLELWAYLTAGQVRGGRSYTYLSVVRLGD